jgi:hypothetical protein
VGGVVNIVTHPVETASGIYAMAEHVPLMGGLVPNPLKLAYAGVDVMFNGADPKSRLETVMDPGKSLQDDAKFGKALVKGFIEPYKKSWSEGKYFEVAGRATFDIGSMFIGAGEANAAIKTGEVASVAAKTAEVANVASKTGEVASVASKTAEVANVATKTGEVANVVSKSGKATEVASTAGKATEVAESAGKTGKASADTSKVRKGAEAAKAETGTANAAKTSEEVATTGKGTTHGERTTNELAESSRGKNEPTIREVEPVDFAPGYSRGLANRKMRRQFATEAKKLGFDVEFVSEGGSYTIGKAKKIVVNEATATPGTLLDEYAHAFNNVHGKGTYLPEELALKHKGLFDDVRRVGSTDGLGKESNFLYHQLELQNYLQYIKQTKGAELPGFIRSVPKSEISKFLEHKVQGMKVGIR